MVASGIEAPGRIKHHDQQRNHENDERGSHCASVSHTPMMT
jgi:hypothetical protein